MPAMRRSTDPPMVLDLTERLSLPPGSVAALWALGISCGALLVNGRRDYPSLHTILDTGMLVLSGLLGLLLWEMSVHVGQPLPRWLAISFGVTSVLAFVHVAVTVDWSGAVAPIAGAAGAVRSATWPPGVHILPIGVGGALWFRHRGKTDALSFGVGLAAVSVVLVIGFLFLPRYVSPGWLGITSPTLILVPTLWAVIAWSCWCLRIEDRLLPRLALMSAVLCLSHTSMLYSRAPNDTQAMVAHLGTVIAYLILLLTIMQLASVDLLARVRAERALAELNQELEGRVLERTKDLDSSNKRLEAAIVRRGETERELRRSNEELERFAYVASHDLQEPLRMVGSYVQLLGKRYRGKLDQDADEFIGFALDGARRMQGLIEDLLAYSRVGTRGAEPTRTDTNMVLARVLDNLRLAIEESGASVTHDLMPMVLGDMGQLEHLFLNLVSNALKFHGAAPPRVYIAAVADGGQWQFRVQDNGIGIEPEYFERIFVIFQRLHGRGDYPGTGLGLAIAKKIVERHGGRIWVESRPGSSTTFYFTLRAVGEA